MTDNTNGNIIVEIQDKIASVTFSHPASNSFPSELLQKLVRELNKISNNSDVNVVILQSEGTTFCAGASFDELIAINDLSARGECL